jgi:hypothetical protein
MRIYKKGGQTDENPPKPAPAPDRLRSRGLPQQPQPELQMNTLGRLQQMMEAMQRSQATPQRDFGPIARRDDVIQYIADKYNMPVEEVSANMPEPVRSYVMPRAGGGGDLEEGAVGMSNKRTFSGAKRRNNPFEKSHILLSGGEADNPYTRNEELIHSMQPRNASGSFIDEYDYNELVDPMLKKIGELEGINMRDPEVRSDVNYAFSPAEMEAKVMTQKMILRNLGVIGEGELTQEDLDNIYLHANDMVRSDDPRTSQTATDLMRLFGSPSTNRYKDPEYREMLLNLFNKL